MGGSANAPSRVIMSSNPCLASMPAAQSITLPRPSDCMRRFLLELLQYLLQFEAYFAPLSASAAWFCADVLSMPSTLGNYSAASLRCLRGSSFELMKYNLILTDGHIPICMAR